MASTLRTMIRLRVPNGIVQCSSNAQIHCVKFSNCFSVADFSFLFAHQWGKKKGGERERGSSLCLLQNSPTPLFSPKGDRLINSQTDGSLVEALDKGKHPLSVYLDLLPVPWHNLLSIFFAACLFPGRYYHA